MRKFLYFFIFLFLFSFLKIEKVEAFSYKTIVINEVMWSGSSRSCADEWIELRNLTDNDIDISGWQIEGITASGETLVIPQGKVIKGGGFFLISNYSRENENTILDIDSDLVTSNISLSNDNQKYFLKDKNGNIIDEIGNGYEPLAGDNEMKYSMERVIDPYDGTKSHDWYTATLALGLRSGAIEKATPGFPNSPPFYYSISKIKEAKNKIEVKVSGIVTALPDIFFKNRLYIQDETAGIRLKLNYDQWPNLEIGRRLTVKGKIKTYYSEKEIQIPDLSEVEISPREKEIVLPFNIKICELNLYEGTLVKISGIITETYGQTFYISDGLCQVKVYVKSDTKINLPEKHKNDKAEIKGIVNNYNGNFRLLPRFDSDIKIFPQSQLEEHKFLPISEAKKQPKGTKVKIRGVVSVTPFVLSDKYFYIQDNTSGIQIYSYYKNFPLLLLGFFIEVIGEISDTSFEKRVKISSLNDILVLEKKPPPKPIFIKIKNAFSFHGMLVMVRGKVIKSSGNNFYISDGTGEIKVYIKKSTGIKKPRLYKGDIVEISGILSQTKNGLRILPRYQSDFKLVWTKSKIQKKSKIKGVSITQTKELNESQVVFEVMRQPSENFLTYLGWGLIVFSLSSIIWLKRLKLDNNVFK